MTTHTAARGENRTSAPPDPPGKARLGIVGRWTLVLALALPGPVLATHLAQAAPPSTVTWESECEGVKRSVTTQVRAPRRLDVCGSPAPDVTATFTADNSGSTMEIRKLPQAAAVLPLKIEAVIQDPRGPASSAVAFGYDARGGSNATSQAPETFRASLSLTGSGASTTTALDLAITGPGATLDVISEVFTRASDGSRTNPQRLRLGYAPVPGSATVTARPAGDGFSLQLGAATPTSLTLLAEDLTVTPQRTLAAIIDPLPTSLAVEFAEAGGGTLTYTASAPVELLTLNAFDPTGLAARATQLELALGQIPTALSLGFAQPGAAFSLDAGAGTLGTIQALLTSGPDVQLPPGEDGVKLVDTAAQYTLRTQLTGVQRVSVRQRPTIDVQVDTAGGRPFGVDLQQSQLSGPDHTLVARVLNLPTILSLAFAEPAGHRQLTSQSSSVIGRIVLDAANVPLDGRVKRVALDLQGVPTSLTLDFGTEGSRLDVDTAGATLGSIEALLTSGPIETVPAGFDGITLLETAAQHTLAVRATGLRRATATQTPLQVFLDATGNNPFRLRLEREPVSGQKLTFTDLIVNTLQRNTQLVLTDTGARTELAYTADAPTNRLDLSTNSGDRQQLAFSAAGPLPTALAVCFDPASIACGNTGRPANKGSLRVEASALTTVNLVDCRAGSCPTPDRQLRMTNLRVRKLEVNLHTEPVCSPVVGCGPDGGQGSVWLDTDSTVLTGEIFSDEVPQPGTSAEVTVRFPPGFSAQNRFVTWDGPFTESEGTINCEGDPGDGQNLDFDVELNNSVTIDVAFLIC